MRHRHEKPARRTGSEPLFVICGENLRIGGRPAFRNLRWRFASDQHWALVGPNGSGKSLLASALAGKVPVAGGELNYGFILPDGRAAEEGVALVSFEQQKAVAGDSPEAMRWFSLDANDAIPVDEFLSRRSVEEVNPFEVVRHSRQASIIFARRRCRVLGLLRIGRLLNRLLPSLSNGEMRKVLLARALLRHPRLLILDDVFTGLDVQSRTRLRRILEDLIRREDVRLLIIASHADELPLGITHLLCVAQNRLVAQGARRVVLRHPRVRELLRGRAARRRGRSLSKFPDWQSHRVTEELIRMRNVSVRYDSHRVLAKVDWTVHRGERWALLGPNGSGKSTLLSLIIGDNPQAYSNEIYLFEHRRGSGDRVRDLKRRIGWVSPEFHLHFPEVQSCMDAVLSGFQDSNGRFLPATSRQREAARQWLAYFGLADCAHRAFGSLSAGLQRMTLLARALVKSPCLLVLDEPCQGLDHAHRALFVRTIESILMRTDTAVIYVTHRSDEIPRGISRVLRLHQGRVVYRSSR